MQEKEITLAKRKRNRKFVWSLKQDKFEAVLSFNKKLTVTFPWISAKCNCLLVLFKHSVDCLRIRFDFQPSPLKSRNKLKQCLPVRLPVKRFLWINVQYILELGSRESKEILSINYRYSANAKFQYSSKERSRALLIGTLNYVTL